MVAVFKRLRGAYEYVELIDAIDDRMVWVDKFSGKTGQLFEFQDLITESVFKNLQINFMSKLGGAEHSSTGALLKR